jgi:hypothetical protein
VKCRVLCETIIFVLMVKKKRDELMLMMMAMARVKL